MDAAGRPERVYTELPLDASFARVRWTRCPAHGCRVGLDKDGHVVGRCGECANEAARGFAVIANGARRA